MNHLKLPPHSIEAEQSLIGAVLIRNDLMLDLDGLPAEAFYRKEHRTIFAAMQSLAEDNTPIDVVSLSAALEDAGTLEQAGGLDYLCEIQDSSPSAYNALHYADIIRTRYLERRLISAGNEIADMGFNAEGDIQGKIDRAGALLSGIEVATSDEPVMIDAILKEAVDSIDRRFNSTESMLGLPTGITDLDKRTNGLQKGDLVLVAGRPSQGKTTLAMNFAEHAAMAGKFVIVFSLEMPREQLMNRMLSSIGRIPYERVKTGKLLEEDWPKLSGAVAKLKGKPYYIDDSSRLTSGQLLTRARKIAQRQGRKPDLVVVDYLQLLTDRGEGVERISVISRNLKLTARELDCPLVALSQLNRSCEARPDKRPLASDLRESGSLEQDADIILMLYRDEVYNEQSQDKGIAEILCRKFRNGETGTDRVSSAMLSQCRFESLAYGYQVPSPAPKKSRRELDYAY